MLALSVATALPALAAGGDLDASFSGDGKVTTNFTPKIDYATDVAIQADGKIVAVGVAGLNGSNPKFAVTRYNPDGTLDTTFSGDGKVTTDFTAKVDVANSVSIQPDGKIVVAGSSGIGGANPKFALARYNMDGSLDTTFSGNGKVTTDFTPRREGGIDVAIQIDGHIVMVGFAGGGGANPRFALARYNTDGSLDSTFSGDGKVTTDFTKGVDLGFGVAIQADGKIVASGGANLGGTNAKFALARYNSDGSLDTTFSGDGKVLTNFTLKWDSAFRVAIQADQKIVAAGEAGFGGSNPKFALARYNTDGSLDTSFSGDGRVTTDFTRREDFADDLAIQADQKIVAAGEAGFGGSNPKFALARYNTDGSLDASFSGNGTVTTDFTAKEDFAVGVAIQQDGNIVAAGGAGIGGSSPRFALARYLAA